MLNRTTAIKAIIDYFEENEDIFIQCVEDLDGWNGYLGDDRYYLMEELSEFYHGVDPIELLQRAYFGYDEDSFVTDTYGERHYNSFNPNRDYFTYNGYGNLVSTDYIDYSAYNDDYFVESLEQNRGNLYSIDEDPELSRLFDDLENAAA